jgi:hypothetical protein
MVGLLWIPFRLSVTRSSEARAKLDEVPATGDVPKVSGSIGTWLRHPAMLHGMLVVLAASPLMSYALNWAANCS